MDREQTRGCAKAQLKVDVPEQVDQAPRAALRRKTSEQLTELASGWQTRARLTDGVEEEARIRGCDSTESFERVGGDFVFGQQLNDVSHKLRWQR